MWSCLPRHVHTSAWASQKSLSAEHTGLYAWSPAATEKIKRIVQRQSLCTNATFEKPCLKEAIHLTNLSFYCNVSFIEKVNSGRKPLMVTSSYEIAQYA
jgi:hypothetical protein